jgi:outer membrane protein assembly factor BamB
MRVLYNLTKRKSFEILLILTLIFIGGQLRVISQNLSGADIDWSLPFKSCRDVISKKTNIKELASDNKNHLYLSTSDGLIQSINLTNFQIEWELDFGSETISNLQITDKNLFLASKSEHTSKNTNLRSISKLTGITLWQISLEYTDEVYLKNNGESLIAFTKNYITSLNSESGQENWRILSNSLDNLVYSSLRNNSLLKVNKNFAENMILKINTVFNFNEITEQNSAKISENSNSLIVGDKLGNINSYDLSNGKRLWNRKIGGEINYISFFQEEYVLISSLDNFLYLFSRKNGKLTWKRKLPYRVIERPFIKDKIVLVVSSGSQTSFIVDLNKGKMMNQITLPDSVYFADNFLIVEKFIVFQTNKGVVLFSQSHC